MLIYLEHNFQYANIYYVVSLEFFTIMPINPTSPFKLLEYQNSSDDVPELSKIRRSSDVKVIHFWKGRSGTTDWKSVINGFPGETEIVFFFHAWVVSRPFDFRIFHVMIKHARWRRSL